MKSFNTFLNEAKAGKNLHLTHVEDSLFDGHAQATDAVNFLRAVSDMLKSNSSGSHSVTTKWDGAPAITCGINPENGKFFVGTKSVFNVSPKLNYTNKDIDRNHGHAPVLASKLKLALEHFPKLGIKGVIQGDLMFTAEDKKTSTIDDVNHITFKPNTILYAVPTDSKLGKIIANAKIGVVWHTEYKGKKLENMRASFGFKANKLKSNRDVWFDDATFKDESGIATFSKSEYETITKIIQAIEKDLSRAKKSIDGIVSDSKIVAELNIFMNSLVREGSVYPTANAFIQFLSDKRDTQVEKLKSEAGKERKRQAFNDLIDDISKNRTSYDLLFDIHILMTKCKIMLINKLKQAKSIGHFLQKPDGLEVTSAEGWVAVDNASGTAYKLVDRLSFSRANFSLAKDWVKG